MTDVQRDAPLDEQYAHANYGLVRPVHVMPTGGTLVVDKHDHVVCMTQSWQAAASIVEALNAPRSESATPKLCCLTGYPVDTPCSTHCSPDLRKAVLEEAACLVERQNTEQRRLIADSIRALKNATSQPQSKAACDPVGNVRIPAESASSSRCVVAPFSERDALDAARWRWFLNNANLGAFKLLARERWNEAVDASMALRNPERNG